MTARPEPPIGAVVVRPDNGRAYQHLGPNAWFGAAGMNRWTWRDLDGAFGPGLKEVWRPNE